MIGRQLFIFSLEEFSEVGKVIIFCSVTELVVVTTGLLVRGAVAVIHFD